MKDQIDAQVGRALRSWVHSVHARSGLTLAICLTLTLVFAVYAGLNLGVNSNNLDLVADDLPSRINHAEFSELFPNLENALLVVVDGETPELARKAAEELETALRAKSDRFEDVYLPGGGSFFERNGLLYRSVDELDIFADRIARVQPIIAELEQDASLGNLTRLVEQGLENVRSEGTGAEDWPDVLERVGQATVDIYTEYPIALSWEEMLLRGSALDMATRRVLILHPILEFGNVFAAGRALDAIHDSAEELGFTPANGVTVRVTGNPALNFEEMAGILWDVFVAGIFCFAIVVVILWFALRSWHIVTAGVATLLIGLVWTAAFAAATVGYLNIVSLAVAILFIGLGVDFAIHLGTLYADRLRSGRSHVDAMSDAVEEIGGSLVLCTLTTAVGFLVFVPTDYRGVAQLGLIAGFGMVIISGLTFTLFPALLFQWLRCDPQKHLTRDVRFNTRWWAWFDEHPRAVRIGAAIAAVTAIWALQFARFDPNVIKMRDPSTESVQTFDDLLGEAGSASPWYVDVIAPNLDAAVALGKRLNALESVSHTITLADYVPAEQEEKHEILEDISFLLDPPPASLESPPPPSAEEQIQALRNLHDFLDTEWVSQDSTELGTSMRELQAKLSTFLERLNDEADPTDALARFETVLLSSLPRQIERLRDALAPDEIDLAAVPQELHKRMLTADGRARVQIFPEHDLEEEEEMRRFADEVASIAPKASGIAINLLAFEEATKRSFIQALLGALAIITLLLWLLWRRVSDMLLVLAPLLLSAVASVAIMGVLGLAFNFVNVIVIPLMFGIGVDSGIHLVHRSHAVAQDDEGLLGSTTARAVYYSAMTTTVSFGSLAFSSHQGMASLGVLLSIGMLLTVIGNLIVLPSLLALRTGSKG